MPSGSPSGRRREPCNQGNDKGKMDHEPNTDHWMDIEFPDELFAGRSLLDLLDSLWNWPIVLRLASATLAIHSVLEHRGYLHLSFGRAVDRAKFNPREPDQ